MKIRRSSIFNPYNSYIFLVACAISVIFIPDYLSPLIANISKILLTLTMIISAIFYIKRGKVSKTFIGIIVFWALIIITTLCNDSRGWQSLFRAAFSSIQICMTLENGFSVDRKKTLGVYSAVFVIIALLNSVTFFAFYNDNWHYRGMYTDGRGDPNYYLLGQDNGTIFYTMPAVLLCAICDLEKKHKISFFTIAATVVLLFSYLWISSGNGIAAYILLLAGILLVNTKHVKTIYEKLKINRVIALSLLIFIFIVFMRTENVITTTITQLLGKNLTFTGRTGIWDIVIDYISNKPLFGYGFLDYETRNYMIPFGKAHNTFLQMIFNGGIACLCTFLITIKNAYNDRKGSTGHLVKEKTLLILYMLIIMIVGNFDFYIDHSLTFLPIILAGIYYTSGARAISEGKRGDTVWQ